MHFRKKKKKKVILHESVFGYKQTQTAHTQDCDLKPYLQCIDKKNTLLRKTHRVYEILPGSKKICCMVHPFLQFLAVKSSKSVKTCWPLCLSSLRCTSSTVSHIQMWALMQQLEESPHQRHCSANTGHRLTLTPKQLPACTKTHILKASLRDLRYIWFNLSNLCKTFQRTVTPKPSSGKWGQMSAGFSHSLSGSNWLNHISFILHNLACGKPQLSSFKSPAQDFPREA